MPDGVRINEGHVTVYSGSSTSSNPYCPPTDDELRATFLENRKMIHNQKIFNISLPSTQLQPDINYSEKKKSEQAYLANQWKKDGKTNSWKTIDGRGLQIRWLSSLQGENKEYLIQYARENKTAILYELLWAEAWKLAEWVDDPDGAPTEQRKANTKICMQKLGVFIIMKPPDTFLKKFPENKEIF